MDDARAQAGGLPVVGELADLAGIDASELRPVPPTDELVEEVVRTVEQTGVDVPDLSGQPPPAPAPTAPETAAPVDLTDAPADEETEPSSTDQGPAAGLPSQGRNRAAAASTPGPPRRIAAPRTPGGEPAAGASAAPAEPTGSFLQAFEELPWTLLIAVGGLALLGLAMTGRSAGLTSLSRRLRKQGDELREDVGALQSALLPTIPESIGSVGVSVAYEAAAGPAAGGDFHDVLRIDDRRVGVIVGDVCGHGREALTITALVHYTVRAYLEAGLQPRDALRLTDDAIGEKLGSDFATVLAAVYDTTTSRLVYSTAGHPAPIVTGDVDRAVEPMTPPPIGVGTRTGTRQTEVAVPAGARVCLFTDGLLEARDREHDLLGRERLVSLIGDLPRAFGGREILNRVATAAATADDLTACVLAPRDAHGDGAVIEELDLDGAGVDRKLDDFLAACGLSQEQVARAGAAIRRCPGEVRLRVHRAAEGGAGWDILGANGELTDQSDRLLEELRPVPLAAGRR